MKRSRDRILTTHAGSLIRPPAILKVLKAEAYSEPYDEQAFASELKGSVRRGAGAKRRRHRRGQ